MNSKNAAQYLPLVQALADGKMIQYHRQADQTWIDPQDVEFIGPPERYRIKPEPRRIVCAINQDGTAGSAFVVGLESPIVERDRVEFIELTPEVKEKLRIK